MNDETLFSGFPGDGLNFLQELARNNNRDWFKARKKEYENLVLRPAQNFVAALGARRDPLAAGTQNDTPSRRSCAIVRF